MQPPVWVNYELSEESAAVMARGLSGSSQAWGVLLAHAQAVLAARTDTRESETVDAYGFDDWRDLIAAARILDSAASDNGLSDSEDRRTAAILAACAFGMCGMAVSAAAVIDSHQLFQGALSPGEITALVLSSPASGRAVFEALSEPSAYRACVESVVSYLGGADEETFLQAISSLDQAIRAELAPWESYLLRLSRLSLSHIRRLATARVLQDYETLFPSGYLGRLVSESPMLLPSQYEALIKQDILEPGCNSVIALPTATGKTLLGELVLMSSLGNEPGLVCYIAPYVALGRQVADKISNHVPGGVRVSRQMGGYRDPAPLDPENNLEVVVATPERFDAMLRLRSELIPFIRAVVFDEAHMIGNGERGIRLEGILTRLRLTEQAPRFALLSAVVSNADDLAAWLHVDSGRVVKGEWRPTVKRLSRWTEDGKLKLHAGDDPLRDQPSQVLGETDLPWPESGFYSTNNFGVNRQLGRAASRNVAYMAQFQYQRYGQPVLCVCTTRASTRQLAAEVMGRLPELEPVPVPIRDVITLIGRKYRYLRPLQEALRRGVAYHNSSLPHPVRQGIEQAVEDRVLKVVAATTTLAEGVDLPFRVTILADWLTFDGEQSRPMEALLFKNIAGRCGRAGKFTEGDTVIFDNPIGDPQLTSPLRRPGMQDDIFFSENSPSLRSALPHVNRRNAVSMVGSQLLAAIHENPRLDDLATSFFESSFARWTPDADEGKARIYAAYQDILDARSGDPLAVAASPARLTEFGQAANSAGLSPQTARTLRSVLRGLANVENSVPGLVRVCVTLLSSLADVPEQTNSDLRKAIANPKSRVTVKQPDLDLVLRQWLEGTPIESIFSEIPVVQRSRRQPSLQTWLAGVPGETTWNDSFTRFHDFLRDCMEFFLPWILRAVRPLADLDGHPERPWGDWARFVELGVDTNWGVRILDAELGLDRDLARPLGLQLDLLHSGSSAPVAGEVTSVFERLVGTRDPLFPQLVNWYRFNYA